MVKGKKIAVVLVACVLMAVCLLVLFLPLPKTVGAEGEQYTCVWEDGTVTTESYLSAFEDVQGIAEDGSIELKRGIHVGMIAPVKPLVYAHAVLLNGSLLELTTLKVGDVSRLGQLALFREHGNTIYYAGEGFRFTGSTVERSSKKTAEKVVLLDGTLPVRYPASVGASKLHIKSEAEFTLKSLFGSRVSNITAEAPYAVEGSALYLDVAGVRRLLAAVPTAEELVLGESDFADEGALLACTNLTALTLPYAGSAKRSAGTDYAGEFAWLFSDSAGYAVPSSLKKVKVTGGELISHCFYACPDLEEVDACGLATELISETAFADMVGWKTVHSPRMDIMLVGNYTSHIAPCGCMVFEKI